MKKIKNLLILLLSTVTLYCITTSSAYAVNVTNVVTGLNGAIGVDLDETNNHLYFVEYNANSLMRVKLSVSPYAVDPAISTGLTHPEDVELDMGQGVAYITTRDNPGTGALYKVDIATGTKTLITFNLGAPQQLALDVTNNKAYVVGYDDGRLRSINLTTGSKTVIITGLSHPVGLIVTKDKQYAYVSEQDAPARISQIDLTTGTKVREMVLAGLTAPFFMEWTDETENSLYVAERDPINRVSRVDLITETRQDAFTSLPVRPSGITIGNLGSKIYITTNSSVVQASLSLSTSEPGFMGVGHIPVSAINSQGYATTDPGYFFFVKNAPFGGTMNIFGNMTSMMNDQAVYYSVLVSKDGAAPYALTNSWISYKWNSTVNKYKPVKIAPEPGKKYYKIPVEYSTNPGLWYPPYIIMRWPSSENGLYTFTLKIFNSSGVELTPTTVYNSMVLRIDNTPPEVKIHNIFQYKPAKTNIEPCVIVDNGLNQFKYKITAYDAEGHLYNYSIRALYGNNLIHSITSDSYNNHITASAPPPPYSYTPVIWNGIINTEVPSSSYDTFTCNCAYTFYISAWGRTINGYNRTQYVKHHKSITINLKPELSICTD